MPGLPDLFSSILPLAKEFMGMQYGACNVCAEPAIPIPCSKCGEKTCLEHAFFSGEMITKRAVPRVLCTECFNVIEVEGAEFQTAPGVADVAKERRAWAFSILGLEEGATQKEIKARYRELAKKYHPDHNEGDKAAEIAFKQVQNAWEILGKSKGKT